MQILIVDDEPMVGKTIADMLEHVGRASFDADRLAYLRKL